MRKSAEYRAQARAALKGNWSQPVLAVLLVSFICSGVEGSFTYVILNRPWLSVLGILITMPLNYAMILSLLLFFRGQKDNCVENAFRLAFKPYSRAFLVEFFKMIMVLLGFALLIVPGIILDLAYSMAEFIAYDEPEISEVETLRRSRRMMKGHKWQLFCLQFSFIGWILLSIISLGIGLLWVIPYMYVSMAAFYEDLRHEDPLTAVNE